MPVIESLLVRCRHFLRGIFRRDDVERELREEFDGYLVAVARTVADPGRAAAPLRAAVADVDADQACGRIPDFPEQCVGKDGL